MIKTDLIVIGAGPTGLFTVFEAGLLGMKCHLVDSLTKPGGQCVEIYPNKPIYDIPAHPEILAGKLVDNLMDQIKPFSPDFSLGEIAQKLEKKEEHFILKTNKGTKIQGKVIVIACNHLQIMRHGPIWTYSLKGNDSSTTWRCSRSSIRY